MKRIPLVEEMFTAAWEDRKTETRRIAQRHAHPAQVRHRQHAVANAGDAQLGAEAVERMQVLAFGKKTPAGVKETSASAIMPCAAWPRLAGR